MTLEKLQKYLNFLKFQHFRCRVFAESELTSESRMKVMEAFF